VESSRLNRDFLELKELIGESKAIGEVKKVIKEVAQVSHPILISGETGVGKTLVARLIHFLSKRKYKYFLHQNCSNIKETLLESELFGFEKGSFTGATERRVGKIERADGGTLFLDEIGDLSFSNQAKLLIFLESGKFYRLGGEKEIISNVRIITASNKDLLREIRERNFREDLYYRISTLELYIPPLRERRGDVPLLIEKIMNVENMKNGRNKRITQEALAKLMKYDFAGNIRELENIIKRAHVFSARDEIRAEDIELKKNPEQKDSSNLGVAKILYKRLKQGADYWQIVHEPFKQKELNKNQIWEIICLALKETPNRKFKESLMNLNIKERDYKKFLNSIRIYERRKAKRRKNEI